MVDVGGDIGALIILTPADLHGAEIDISPHGAAAARTHVAVRERRGPGPSRYAAVFPSLTAGAYTIWRPDGQAAAEVTVAGGQVAQITWPDTH